MHTYKDKENLLILFHFEVPTITKEKKKNIYIYPTTLQSLFPTYHPATVFVSLHEIAVKRSPGTHVVIDSQFPCEEVHTTVLYIDR